MEMSIKSNIWKYYVFHFLYGLIFFLPFLIYYFQDLGFSLTEIMLMNGGFAVSLFIFEVPTGYIADKIGRKKSLIICVLLYIFSVLLLIFTDKFILIFSAFILYGLADAFLSGADTALLYDSLIELKSEKDFKKIDGKAKFFMEIGIIIAAIAGSYIVSYGIRIAIIVTLFTYIIMLPLTISFIEPKPHKKKTDNPKSIILDSIKTPKLLKVFIYSFFVFGLAQTTFMFYQPFLREVSVPIFWFGWIFAFFSIVSAICSYKAHDIEAFFGTKNLLIIMPLMIALSFFLSAYFFVWWAFIFFAFREFVRGLWYVIIGDYINKLVDSSRRATVLSIGNMSTTVGFFAISVLVGMIADISLRNAFITASLVSLVLALIAAYYFKSSLFSGKPST